MLQNIEIPNAELSICHGTSAHETGTASSFPLTGNPYTDFARLGMDLQGCHVRYRRTPNAQGHTLTGTFNICGTGYTMGADSYAQLVERVFAKWQEKQAYRRRCRAEKRMRNTLAFIARHPDATILPAYLS